MTVDDAVRVVRERFPFPGYMDQTDDVYHSIAGSVLAHLPIGSTIVDFGAGPCDRTAVLQLLGYQCSAVDDLQDAWHLDGNGEKILSFARDLGIDYRVITDGQLPFDDGSFDMVMANDVIEHLHDSPREILCDLLSRAKERGLVFITVPNAVNLRKRIDVLRGRTNLPPYREFYWYPGHWRGHVREYTKGDLVSLAKYLDLEVVSLRSVHHMLFKLPRAVRPIYRTATSVFPGWRDSWILVARKTPGWAPRRSLSAQELRGMFGVERIGR